MNIQEIEARLAEIRQDIETRGEAIAVDELERYETEIATLTAERSRILSETERRSGLLGRIAAGTEGTTIRNAGQSSPEGFGSGNSEAQGAAGSPYEARNAATGSIEYRNAFMRYIQTGNRGEVLRSNEFTSIAEAAALIPTTIVEEVIRKLGRYGTLFSRIRRFNVQGGMNVPILDLAPEASWIDDTTPSEDKQFKADKSVSFMYHGLECKVAQSLIASIVSLNFFEAALTDLITEAMMRKIDQGIVKGTGTGQFTGITVDARVPADNKVTLTAAEFGKWTAWKKAISKLGIRYKAGASWIMSESTFDAYIDGMTDAQGQPIARVNYNITEGNPYRFAGKEVITVEDDVIASYDTAQTGDVVAILCNLKNYGVNSNLNMSMYKWTNHETNKVYNKALMVADGKLLDPNGVVIIKKGA